MALVFEGAADGVDDGVVHVGTAVDEVVVFTACLADYAGIALVPAFSDAGTDFAVEATENGGAAGVMETGKLTVAKHDTCNFFGIARHKLDDVRRQTSFHKDGVYYPIGRDC